MPQIITSNRQLITGHVALETLYIFQAIKYGRREWAPQLSQRAFAAICLLMVGIAVIIWAAIKAALDDPLYIVAFGLTVVVYPLSAIPMMVRRGSSKGQSSLMWFGYIGLAVGYFSATILYFGSAFRSFTWVGLGLISVGAGIFGWILSKRLSDRPLNFMQVPREDFPHLTDLADHYAEHWSDDAFEFGLDVVLDALEPRKAPRSQRK